MIKRTRMVIGVTSALVFFAGVMGFLGLNRFAEDPTELLLPAWEDTAVPLLEGAARLVVERGPALPFSQGRARRLTLEKAGQPVLETPLYADNEPDLSIAVYWYPPTPDSGAFLRLSEARGEILVDIDAGAAARILRGPGGPILASAQGNARIGVVITAEQQVMHLEGMPLYGPALHGNGTLIGTVTSTETGALIYTPVVDAGTG